MTLQKQTCGHCGKTGKMSRIIVIIDGNARLTCEKCLANARAKMLKDPNHPAWKYYSAVAKALGYTGKAETDD